MLWVLCCWVVGTSAYTILEKTFEGPDCTGAPWQIVIVVVNADPQCPFPGSQCRPGPLNQSTSDECTSVSGPNYQFPSGFAVNYVFHNSPDCSANTTATTVGIRANKCFVEGYNQRVKFDCQKLTVTQCVG